jgi:hypothetical protein
MQPILRRTYPDYWDFDLGWHQRPQRASRLNDPWTGLIYLLEGTKGKEHQWHRLIARRKDEAFESTSLEIPRTKARCWWIPYQALDSRLLIWNPSRIFNQATNNWWPSKMQNNCIPLSSIQASLSSLQRHSIKPWLSFELFEWIQSASFLED